MISKAASPTPPTPPLEAYRFSAEALQVAAAEAEAGASGPRRLNGVAYSGQPIRNHWFWGTVAFDLASTSAAERVPVLIEHDRGQRAGFCGLAFGDKIELKDGVLLANELGQTVAAESDAGFPWQMSVHIEPGSIEEVQAGATVSVNGYQLQGPAVIFRNGSIREVSLTPVGYDPNTNALAASLGARSPQQKEHSMTIEQLQEQVQQFTSRVANLEASVTTEKTRADAAEAALAANKKAQRADAIKALFSAVGIEFSDAAAAPYLSMEEAAFSVAAEQMRGLKPAPQPHLFQAQATGGAEPEKQHQLQAGSLKAAASKFSVKS